MPETMQCCYKPRIRQEESFSHNLVDLRAQTVVRTGEETIIHIPEKQLSSWTWSPNGFKESIHTLICSCFYSERTMYTHVWGSISKILICFVNDSVSHT